MVAECTTVGADCGMTREQLMDRIAGLNPSASPEFLARFGLESLGNYFEHLLSAQEPRGRMARWVRRPETAAISRWEPKG